MSSDDYAEKAHRLYTEGRYDAALDVLREAIDIFPQAAELHVGIAYAHLARDEIAWALQSFNEGLALEPNNEDGLAGLGEVLLKVGKFDRALKCFDMILALGFRKDHDLMQQVGRTLFREGVFDRARDFFELVLVAHPESAEGAACLGYAAHRLGDDEGAVRWLRRALELDPNDAEAQIYLGNVLYDGGDFDGALEHFDSTSPRDHVEELALWRYVALKKSMYRLDTADPDVPPTQARRSPAPDRTPPRGKGPAPLAASSHGPRETPGPRSCRSTAGPGRASRPSTEPRLARRVRLRCSVREPGLR